MRDPDLLVYWREEVGGLITGGYERNPRALRAGRHPGRFQVQAAAAGLGALYAADGELDPPRAGGGEGRDRPAAQRAGGLHPRRRIPARPDRRARASGWRAPSAPTAWPGPAASARPWPSGSSTAPRSGIVAARRAPLWPATTPASLQRGTGPSRPTPSTTTSTSPARSGSRPGRFRLGPAYTGSRTWARSSARSSAGSGPTGIRRMRSWPTHGHEPQRLGAASTGRRPSDTNTCRHARTPGCSTKRPSARSRCAGRGRSSCCSTCAPTTSTSRWARCVYTSMLNAARRHRVRFHRDARWRQDRFLIVTGTAFGQHDLSWIRLQYARQTARCRSTT